MIPDHPAPRPFAGDLLDGRVVLVTGGGTGLGRAIARACAAHGAKVALVGRRPEPLQNAAAEIAAAGGVALALPCDVRDSARVAAAFDAAERSLGPVDRLVNGAAGNFLSPSEELSDNAFDAVIRIVLHGTFNCTREFGRRRIAAGGGGTALAITATYASSNSGSAFVLPSACAKAGVLALIRSLAVEWAEYGIRLNAIAPGPFPTEGAFSRLLPGSELEKQALARVPAGRFGDPLELANLALFLLSDAAPYQTGDCVTVDGAEALFSGQQFAGFARLPRTQAKAMMAALKPEKRPSRGG